MNNAPHVYIAIDLKSFFASVECVERGLNPLTTNLVVADASRTAKTICLAVSPSLKAYGIGGRPRLFEVEAATARVNQSRLSAAAGRRFSGSSANDVELKANPQLKLDYIVAPPRMAKYIDYSARIYKVYLKYVSPDDIHPYSIDEVFIDATQYLNLYKTTPHSFAMTMVRDVLKTTGITATAGIGTNLYLSKVAMDIMAKHMPADSDGVRIAELNEMSYREQLWGYRPLTAFWRVGRGTARKLESYGMYTMGDIALQSVEDEDVLYNLFGVNAELLIDHAWGWEPCTIADIKAYAPHTRSLSTGQVLKCPYPPEKARVVAMEMAEEMAMSLLEKRLVTDQITLTVDFDAENLATARKGAPYLGEITTDFYGRKVPKSVHGSENIDIQTSSSRLIVQATTSVFNRIVGPDLLIRRLTLSATHVVAEEKATRLEEKMPEIDLFTDLDAVMRRRAEKRARREKERRLQETILRIRKLYGKNAMLKGLDFEDGATARERNQQIGGHKA